MLAFKWDHAVRDFQDPEKRFPTLCCLPANGSKLDPPIDECADPARYHEARSTIFLPLICSLSGASCAHACEECIACCAWARRPDRVHCRMHARTGVEVGVPWYCRRLFFGEDAA